MYCFSPLDHFSQTGDILEPNHAPAFANRPTLLDKLITLLAGSGQGSEEDVD